MVKGLDTLRAYFEGYEKHYIIIGGTACEIRLESKGVDFRATKDIDMLLIIEALDKPFLESFWQFIKDGEYTNRYIDEQERKFFRFSNPKTEGFPTIVELFSRKPDNIVIPEDFHLTPIPTDEELSSLSAMLLNDDYYEFTIKNCDIHEELMVANELALIALKVKAYLNNTQRKAEGHAIQENDVVKHKKDVLKLIATLNGNTLTDCPDAIKEDINKFITLLKDEKTDIRGLVKEAGLGEITLDNLLDQLEKTFE